MLKLAALLAALAAGATAVALNAVPDDLTSPYILMPASVALWAAMGQRRQKRRING